VASPVTVLVPTHSHSLTIRLSVRSALAQSIQDVEVIIVGDGATEETRDAARELAREDGRVRVLEFPKGERHGERSRHVALEGARGDVVCYLADDDLWLPDHVAYMCDLLQSADFAVGARLMVHPSGKYEIERVDLAYPSVRERLMAGQNNASLSTVAHTMRAYRALPFGWRPAPEPVSPPLYMWQQFMADAACRAITGTRLTSINFPDSWRSGWSAADRAREIAPVAARLADPDFHQDLHRHALTSALAKWAHIEAHVHKVERYVAHLKEQIETLRHPPAQAGTGSDDASPPLPARR
jgi:glycosyltransferase involved in cell wall biosynthesis